MILLPIKKIQDALRSTTTPRWLAIVLLLVVTCLWGASTVIVKPALDSITPFQFLFGRFFIASLFAVPFLATTFTYRWKPSFKQMRSIVTIECLGTTLALSFLLFGLRLSSASETAILMATQPVFVAVSGSLFLKEKESFIEWLGLGLALFGTLFITLSTAIDPTIKDSPSHLLGNIFLLASVVSMALYLPLAKKTYRDIPKSTAANISFLVGFFSFGILTIGEALVTGQLLTVAGSGVQVHAFFAQLLELHILIPILYAGFFVSVIGSTSYIKAQDGVKAAEASMIYYITPAITITLAFFFLGEVIHSSQIIGIGIVILGIGITEIHLQYVNRLLQSPRAKINFIASKMRLKKAMPKQRYKRTTVPHTLP